ncbi:hypothetical protein Indivirus_1_100 [Indivirus ILV1]|uniref:BAX inhibitor BI-1 n=1 Tax=Indivirus ILV1 TaxID=1977633 RepID=A0A1V0SCM8_9VIRU|nr:hypothetical protein Indivirus_1_100 [Indivirus ILV1]
MNIEMNTEMTILLVMIFVAIYLIYDNYQHPVNSKDFIINIYLYIFVALLFIAVASKYVAKMKISDPSNAFKLVVVYFILACGGLSMMFSDQFFVNHIGFLLLLLALSLMVGTSTKYSSHVPEAAAITAIIVSILTGIVYFSSEETLIRMSGWIKNLLWVLVCVIIIELGYFFLGGANRTFYKVMAFSVIILFGFFVLSDTSRLLLESQNLSCKTHGCINYPLKASKLVLDYVNIFLRVLRLRNSSS